MAGEVYVDVVSRTGDDVVDDDGGGDEMRQSCYDFVVYLDVSLCYL